MGESLTREELDRLHRQRSVVGDEFVISASRGSVTVKRYVGIDSAEMVRCADAEFGRKLRCRSGAAIPRIIKQLDPVTHVGAC